MTLILDRWSSDKYKDKMTNFAGVAEWFHICTAAILNAGMNSLTITAMTSLIFWKFGTSSDEVRILRQNAVYHHDRVHQNTNDIDLIVFCCEKRSCSGSYHQMVEELFAFAHPDEDFFEEQESHQSEPLDFAPFQSRIRSIIWKSSNQKFCCIPGDRELEILSDDEITRMRFASNAAAVAEPFGGVFQHRRKRAVNPSKKYEKEFNIIDLFTGNGILSGLPQLLINIYTFFANLFPDNTSSDDVDESMTEPEAESITKEARDCTTKSVAKTEQAVLESESCTKSATETTTKTPAVTEEAKPSEVEDTTKGTTDLTTEA